MNAHFQRAALLLEQRKYDLAEQEFRLSLSENPDFGPAHALLALCLLEREKLDEATAEAREAVHRDPEDAFSHYALGRVWMARNRFDEAAAAGEEAVRIDPEDADYPAFLAQVRYAQRRWPAALEAAERGLALDPEHVGCTNLRAMALIKLGRKAEAGTTLDAALARDPEDAFSHANRGWSLLEQGEPQKAAEHFREALRLEPNLEHARAGIVEALKAKNFLYRFMLRYFLWMSKLGGNAQWAVIIGGYLGHKFLLQASRSNPKLAPFLLPLIVAYVAFAIMTWIAQPLFNLLLRCSRFGRLVLSREEILESNVVGFFLAAGLGCLAAWLVQGHPLLLLGALSCGLVTLPASAAFRCERGWPRRVMAAYVAGLLGAGTAFFLTGKEAFLTVFLVGAFLSQWVANGLMAVSPRR